MDRHPVCNFRRWWFPAHHGLLGNSGVSIYHSAHGFCESVPGNSTLVVGALLMLFGAGEWRRWAYLWVFVSTPIAISSLVRLPPFFGGGKITGMLIFSLPVVISYVVVRGYYRKSECPRAE
jgi:hypothetical protein